MSKTHQSQIEGAMSRLAQTAYGIERASGADWRRIVASDQTVWDLDTSFENDANYDTGSDLANDIWAVNNDSSITVPFDFNFQDIPYWLHMALGGYAVSGSAAYSHVFTPQNVNVSRQFPVRTFLKKYGGLKTLMIPDGRVEQLTISGGKSGRLTCSAQVRGSGRYEEDPAGYAVPALEDDREFGYASHARFRFDVAGEGTRQVETLTLTGTASASGNITVVLSGALLTKDIIVAVTNGDSASVAAGKVRETMVADPDVYEHFIVSGAGANVILTARIKAANDTTLEMATNSGATGLDDIGTSASTTAGVAGDTQSYHCLIQSWSLNFSNPEADPGYNACSDYLVDGDVQSGQVRSEHLTGVRDYMFDFEVWLDTGDKMRGWLRERQDLVLTIPIVSEEYIPTTGAFYQMTIEHTKARIIQAKETISGNFIGISGRAQLLSDSGAIPLTVTVINDVPSYTS